jgi:hypothetical protein
MFLIGNCFHIKATQSSAVIFLEDLTSADWEAHLKLYLIIHMTQLHLQM